MTSKIKVDNINKVSDDSNIIKKCGTTVTVGAASDGVRTGADNLQAADGGNLISQSGTTITLGASGDTIALASGASQTGFGRTGTVDWDTTPKTASFAAVSGNGYFVNTTGGAITVTIPGSPSAGDIISLADYAGTWGTNNVNLSSNIYNGSTGTPALSTNNQTITLIYVDGTKGWITTNNDSDRVSGFVGITATGGTITCCGDYKIHTFTGPGTFTVTRTAVCASNNVVDYLVVAGGGSGGGAVPGGPVNSSGGGGAGGFRFYHATLPAPSPATPLNNFPSGTAVTVTATGYPITIGAGGSNPGSSRGPNGNPTTFSTITSTAGGAGGQGNSGGTVGGNGGGSGGGAGVGYPGTASGGTGNTPPVSPPQGNAGGPASFGGGGGGALAAGTSSSPTSGGVGAGVVGFGAGNGECSSCIQYFAGGGGRGGSGQSGLGGGGCGVSNPDSGSPIRQGTANTGGGGGGSGYGSPGCLGYPGSNGGSGIVVIRYKFQ